MHFPSVLTCSHPISCQLVVRKCPSNFTLRGQMPDFTRRVSNLISFILFLLQDGKIMLLTQILTILIYLWLVSWRLKKKMASSVSWFRFPKNRKGRRILVKQVPKQHRMGKEIRETTLLEIRVQHRPWSCATWVYLGIYVPVHLCT